jgi:ribulose-phosphate 3-epimerase
MMVEKTIPVTALKRKIRIAPSILGGDQGNLAGALEIAVAGRADQIHLDVIDGHFAPNITFGPGTVKALRKKTDLKFDTHLMISEPEAYVDKFLDAGSDLLTFHVEVLTGERFDALYSKIHGKGKVIGLALKPATEMPPWVEQRLDKLDTLIVMTVNPGFSGQSMMMSVMPKLEKVTMMLNDKGLPVDIEIDGGVEPENVGEVVLRGGNVLVAGAGVYYKPDPVKAVGVLREKAAKAIATGAP